MDKDVITVETTIKAPLSNVWEFWNKPEHIMHWAFASDDWEATGAENDLQRGGKFKTHMAAKDKSDGFDFEGVYTDVKEHKRIEYDLEDGRHVKVEFIDYPDAVIVRETFEPEQENTKEMQQSGWQGILNNFKKYVESMDS